MVKKKVYGAGVKYDGKKGIGEIASFCLNAKKQGFSCYVDTRIDVKHRL